MLYSCIPSGVHVGLWFKKKKEKKGENISYKITTKFFRNLKSEVSSLSQGAVQYLDSLCCLFSLLLCVIHVSF